ncbi:MAG: hypothetical protein IH878_14420 [Gemmatimonadetes bacterium]|nr:hypothetical protein [Gemmatimonadota bacterium]
MQQIHPAARFQGQLIDRSRGRPGLGAPSSRELMEQVPAWTEFIKAVTGWERVEHGTLTLDHVQPLPLPTLGSIVCLGIEPEGLFDEYSPSYGRLMRHRGTRRFYGAIARAGDLEHIAAVSQQENPALDHRLEVYSSVRLRDTLQIDSGAEIEVAVYHRDDWVRIFGRAR